MSDKMNPWLASIYGTDGAEDLEKTAQAALLNKLAAEENIDLSQFSPEELQQLLIEALGEEGAQQAMGAVPGGALQGGQQDPMLAQMQQGYQQNIGQNGLPQNPQVNQQSPQSQGYPPGTDMNPTQAGFGQQPNVPGGGQQRAFAPAQGQQAQQPAPQQMQAYQQQPQGGSQDMASLQKEAQQKFDEADLLGRVMAHAYTNELEKIAATHKSQFSSDAGSLDERISRRSMGEKPTTMKMRFNSAKNTAKSGVGHAKGAVGRAAGHAANFARNNKKGLGIAGAGLAAGAAAGAMARGKSKEASVSAFEKLAEMQAAEILSATGYDPSTGVDTLSQGGQEQQGQQTYQTQPYIDQQAQFNQQQPQQGYQQPQQAQDPNQLDLNQEPSQEFQGALDNRALEMLSSAGYDVNEILARIQLADQQGGQGQA